MVYAVRPGVPSRALAIVAGLVSSSLLFVASTWNSPTAVYAKRAAVPTNAFTWMFPKKASRGFWSWKLTVPNVATLIFFSLVGGGVTGGREKSVDIATCGKKTSQTDTISSAFWAKSFKRTPRASVRIPCIPCLPAPVLSPGPRSLRVLFTMSLSAAPIPEPP